MEILFENKNLIVALKEPGVSSEDTSGPCMPALIRERLGKTDAYVGIIHRLDTAAGGVMVYALSKEAAAFLSKQVSERQMQKEYLDVCLGIPEPQKGEMRDFLFKDSRINKVFPVKSERKGAKEAVLNYNVLKTAEYEGQQVSLCSALLHTGRTHQIRVQFASRKHPLLGDGKYGSRIKGPMALWCHTLSFTLPGEKEKRIFTSEPQDGFFKLFAG